MSKDRLTELEQKLFERLRKFGLEHRKEIDIIRIYMDGVFKVCEDKHTLKETKELAKNELLASFPFMMSRCIISLYTSLEATIKDCITIFIKETPDLTKFEVIGKLKVSIAEYSQLDDDKKYDYIYENYEREVSKSIPYGPNRFDALFTGIGFPKKEKFPKSRDLLELSQVRNCLIHRSGRVDKQFLEKCPWMQLKVGDSLYFGVTEYLNYSDTCHQYTMHLAKRITGIIPLSH